MVSDGRELFYCLRDKALMVVQIDTSNGFSPSSPESLIEGDYRLRNARDFDITRDGRRFLMTKIDRDFVGANPRSKLNVVLNRLQNL